MDPQKPPGSGFGSASIAGDVLHGVNLAGKTSIVTGGYSGIGLPTADALAAADATVIVPARDTGKAMTALRQVSGTSVEPMDLQDPASIDAFAKRVLLRNRGLPQRYRRCRMSTAPAYGEPSSEQTPCHGRGDCSR